MRSKGAAISNEVQFKLVVDKLEVLLRQQLDLAREGNMAKVEVLAEKARELVEQISKSEFVAGQQFKERREGLEQLYGQIALAVSAHMNDVSQALGRIYKGKKTIALYRDNV